jgi:hypothetical protein
MARLGSPAATVVARKVTSVTLARPELRGGRWLFSARRLGYPAANTRKVPHDYLDDHSSHL